ncbi:MAG: carbon-nitrogen hydrolase family protein [Thermoproteus sp. AZ2]|uniref:Carbon-nitrogen hydrolase family protein n=1 Tax=Thermoproteus sp. AZ2 TaxID=1609232 RepID=A0ACC6V1T4_9CREN|nr:MAG: hypothetical protein TU35_00035 [Thermoproteus sp. AZ2]
MRLALVQVKKWSEDRRVVDLLSTISADVVLLPENWRKGVAREEELFKFFSSLPDFELLVPGAFYVASGGETRSRAYVLRRGRVVDYCEKLFPSFAVGEAASVRPGNKLCAQRLGWAYVGVLICVDIVFPELARLYAVRGVNVLLNPANITADRIPLWRSIILARAFENHAYVAFANNVGGLYADGRPVLGGSAAASPNGHIIAEGGDMEGVVYASLNEEEVEYARRRRRYLEYLSSFNSSSVQL